MTKTITLTQGLSTVVDDVDYIFLAQWKWQAALSRKGGKWYAVSSSTLSLKRKNRSMHRLIGERMGIDLKANHIDHVNGDSLDNRRENLRAATRSQNESNRGATKANTSGYKGVSWSKKDKRWRAMISANGKTKFLGNFVSPEDAARAYDDAAREFHGKFAFTNFPEETKGITP